MKDTQNKHKPLQPMERENVRDGETGLTAAQGWAGGAGDGVDMDVNTDC